MLLHFVNEVVFSIIEGLIILILFICLADKKSFIKENKFKSIIFILLFTIFSYWATMYILPGIHSFVIYVFLITLLSFLTNSSMVLSTVTNIIISLFFIATELAGTIVVMLIMNSDLSIINNPHIKLIILCVVRSLQLLVSLILLHSKKKLPKLYTSTKWGASINLQIFQIFLFCMFLLSISYASFTKENVGKYQVLLFIITFLFIILSYYDYKERERMLAQNRKFEAQSEYVKTLEEFVNTLRKEKHDYANHLNTLHVICRINKPDSLERIDNYLNKLTEQIQSSYQSFSTGSDYIDALLAVKGNFAVQNNISLKVDFNAPVSKLDILDSDIISIFGNIIDNALEALLQDTGNANKTVTISTYVTDYRYIIRISNNGPTIPEKNFNRIFEGGFSTKSDRKDRGFGLQIVRQNVINNNGIIKVSSSEGKTTFDIEFNISESTSVGLSINSPIGV